jgi:ketosteroid isomerase-like protein
LFKKPGDVRQSGDIAWATCRLKAETVVHADKSPWTLEVRCSFVLKREKDDWKIALEHFSPIEDVPRVQRRR